MFIPRLSRTIKNIQRLRDIINVFAKHGFGDLLDRMNLRRDSKGELFRRFRRREESESLKLSIPERLRMAFEELGATFIKLGQILSTRPDIIPQEFITELEKLQSNALSFPFPEVERIIDEDLNLPVEKIFMEFEQTPFAAASIAQVHRAKLNTGERVVVKIQRPGIYQLVETDINILSAIAKLLEKHVAESRLYNPTELIDEFKRNIRRELDFTTEGANTDYFYRVLAGNKKIKIPKVYWRFTSRRILTLEEIRGIKIDVIETLDETSINRKEIAKTCIELFFEQIFKYGFFHADPHPGNLFVLEDGRIGLVDFGMVGHLSGEMLRYITSWLLALLKKDVDQIVKLYLRLGIIDDDTNIVKLKIEMAEFLDRYLSMPLEQIRIGELINETLMASMRYQIKFPSNFLMLGKAIITIEGVVTRLDPEFEILNFTRPYTTQLLRQQLRFKGRLQDIYGIFDDVSYMVSELPLQLNQILRKLQKGKLRLDIELPSIDRLNLELDKVSNRISFSLIIAALIVGSSIIVQNTGVFGYRDALGILGFAVAGILGLWLVISMLRSGRL
ncbi:TPA: AarF/ABC1/UbiB kinase family protein [Candidatus Poribacteria bacterium]|nr:AarF/ABC1/UbiB kinase family protein [Candidatus Poribacteria bacterium]